jgi:hypothetical protein
MLNMSLIIVRRAAMVALWRPSSTGDVIGIPSDQEESWKAMALQKVKTAATNTNNILDNIVGGQLVNFIGPMT